MNTIVGRARVGQWYLRWDTGGLFQVLRRDSGTGEVTVRGYDGEVDGIHATLWETLPLGFVEHPEEWTRVAQAAQLDSVGEFT